jgi:phosphoacetylglucosamine mutase
MLENAWESHATALANAPYTPAFTEAVGHLIKVTKIDLNKPSRVVYARDLDHLALRLFALWRIASKPSV